MKRISWIDSLKGVAVVMIFFVHCVGQVSTLRGITVYGQYGVEIFLLCNGFLSQKEYAHKAIPDVKKWIKKRAIRIIPTLWLFLLITWILNYVNIGSTFNNMSHLLKNNTYATIGSVLSSAFLCNFVSPKWAYFSLFTETYTLSSLIFLVLRKIKAFNNKNLSIYAVSMCALLIIPSVFIHFNPSNMVVYYYFEYNLRGITAFFAGCSIYEVINNKSGSLLSNSTKNIIAFAMVILTAYSVINIPHWNSTFFILFLFIFIICQYNHPWKFWDNFIWQFLGKYSYTFYFIHPIIFYALFDTIHGIFLLITSFLITVFLSIILTELYEKPIIKILRKITI